MALYEIIAFVAKTVDLDWTQIIVQIIATAGILLGAGIPTFVHLNKKVDKVHDNSQVIRQETRNAHDPSRPMRHDIDVLLSRTKDISEIKKDIGGMRSDIRQLYQNDHDIWDKLAGRWSKRDTGSFSTQEEKP